jgi:hypothetical protein
MRNRKHKLFSVSRSERKLILLKLLLRKLEVDKKGCWVFTGKVTDRGYGELFLYTRGNKRNTRVVFAHRLAYRLFIGKLKKGMEICHRCDNRKCCNPSHLYQGTHQDNMNDMKNRNRQYITWGERSGVHKLTTQEVREIRASNARQIDLAHKYGVAKSTICEIVNGTSRCYE